MKRFFATIASVAVALPLIATNISAAETKPAEKKLTPQQSKMATCSREAKGLKGAEYKKARKECMARDATVGNGDAGAAKAAKADQKNPPAADKPSPKQKMANCSQQNKGLKGDEYKKAEKECLSK